MSTRHNTVDILLVGIGGYGNIYLNGLIQNEDNNDYKYKIKGTVEPYPSGCDNISYLEDNNIPIYNSMDEFFNQHSADLTVISSPIHYHSRQTIKALEEGSNVLCEKPVCGTVQELKKMKAKRDKTNQFVTIGYQWSFADAILDLKKDIINGKYGKPEKLKTIVKWPRDKNYYNRNSWAGKIKDNNGNWILDSVANNATAHYLHNMFFVLGESLDSSAQLNKVKSELYRGNDIENFDTAVFKVLTEKDVEVLYLGTHAVQDRVGPKFEFEFENGVVKYEDKDRENDIIGELNNGEIINYGNPFADNLNKLWLALEAVNNDKVLLPCSLEASAPQLITINAAQENTKIIDFPEKVINYDQDKELIWIENLSEVLNNCYKEFKSPGEIDISWSENTEEIDVTDYNNFKGIY